MKLFPDHVYDMRDDPVSFRCLSKTVQNELLTIVCGGEKIVYKSQEWPKSRFATTIPVTNDDPWLPVNGLKAIIVEMISAELHQGNWTRAAQLMIFFRVKLWNFTEFLVRQSFIEFSEVFPMGCFEKAELLGMSHVSSGLSWCHGSPTKELLNIGMHIVSKRPDIFKQICSLFETRQLSVSEAGECIRMCDKIRRELKIEHPAAMSIIDVLNSQKLDQVYAYRDPLVLYPCLLSHDYTSLDDPIMECRRPTWTRQNHRMLAHETFFREVQLVLMMQKFHYAEFSLHRNLIDMLLGYLFAAHIDDMEKKLDARKQAVQEILNLPEPQQISFCLRREVVYDISHSIAPIHYIADALIVESNGIYAETVRHTYRSRLITVMRTWDTLKMIVNRLIVEGGIDNDRKAVNLIIIYCQREGINVVDLCEGVVVLNEDDFESLIKLHKMSSKKMSSADQEIIDYAKEAIRIEIVNWDK